MSSKSVFHGAGNKRISPAKILSVLLILSLLLIGQAAIPAHATGTTRYVKPGGLSSGTCNSWVNGCDLQFALNSVAVSGDQLWVKQGTYKPTATTDQTISFALKNGVAMYGGFAGTETLLSQRNPATHVTILSGEIGAAGTSDNSYHVVTSSGANSTTVLDGFTVTAGNASGSFPYDRGGGMDNDSSSPTVTNVIFSGNFAIPGSGGGMYNSGSNPTLTNVTFSGNSAPFLGGGGMYNNNSSPTLMRVTFSGNSAANSSGGGMENSNTSNPTLTNVTFNGNSALGGGGMHNCNSSPTLTNVTFGGNSAGNSGGAIENECGSNPIINDGIFWGSGSQIYNGFSTATIKDSIVAGGCPSGATCTHVLSSDPLLGSLANNGGFTKTMALKPGSPAINSGGQNSTCAATDQRGVTRPQGPACDMGAYEVVATFADVPTDYWAWSWIERLYSAGITGGCASNPLRYCPEANVSRAEMAVFLERGIHGSSFNPPIVTLTFTDTTNNFARYWIEALKSDGITSGCGPSLYCPNASTTRAEMAIFLLRSKHGASYNPPAATGTLFTDVPSSYWAARWIEQLANEGITSGCGTNLYCPDATVTRAQMAIFLVRTFNLP